MSPFVDTLTGGKKDAENMPTELNTPDSLANIEYQSEKYLETKTMPSEMPIEPF
ncbi:hypothetical protein [Selenomonas sp. ND2010]|uniref:hypothetical protein n=1 Tax=Selenomonas sp. ND2010 TaxID=1410618 RepID=UPI0012DF7273|nr:hypothetical protein [Selenomonas sp. ND2010]